MSFSIIRISGRSHPIKHPTHHAPLALFPAAEHGPFPLQRSKSGVHVLNQLVSVVQLNQLEGLFSPNTHYDRVGQRAGAVCFLYGQNLVTKMAKRSGNAS